LEDFTKVGERTWNLERLWNLQAGLTAADDNLPERLLKTGHRSGPAKGVTVNLAAMLPVYYETRGWDTAGVPSEAKLAELGLANLVAIGLAKKEELIYTRDSADPLAFAPGSPALLLLQRIRDEAHRFAVTFHRRARAMRDLRSELDTIPGVGPRRRRALLTQFGSLAGVRRATREELIAVVGPKVADALLAYFVGKP